MRLNDNHFYLHLSSEGFTQKQPPFIRRIQTKMNCSKEFVLREVQAALQEAEKICNRRKISIDSDQDQCSINSKYAEKNNKPKQVKWAEKIKKFQEPTEMAANQGTKQSIKTNESRQPQGRKYYKNRFTRKTQEVRCLPQKKECTMSAQSLAQWAFINFQLDYMPFFPPHWFCPQCGFRANLESMFCVNCFVAKSYYSTVNNTPFVSPDLTFYQYEREEPEEEQPSEEASQQVAHLIE